MAVPLRYLSVRIPAVVTGPMIAYPGRIRKGEAEAKPPR